MIPTIDRNPDVNLEIESIPEGHYLHEGKNLMHTARHAKVPFGVAARRKPCSNSSRLETVGLVIRNEDRKRLTEALAKKEASRKI